MPYGGCHWPFCTCYGGVRQNSIDLRLPLCRGAGLRIAVPQWHTPVRQFSSFPLTRLGVGGGVGVEFVDLLLASVGHGTMALVRQSPG